MPAIATMRGRYWSARVARCSRPALSSALLSSEACAVGRGTRLVMPRPRPGSRSCSLGASRRGVNPDRARAGQNRFPGRAKCQPVAAEYRPGLIPQNSTQNGAPGSGSTSGMVRSRAASRSIMIPACRVLDAGGAADRGEGALGVADRHDQLAERRFLAQLDPYRRTAGLDGGEAPAALVVPGAEGHDAGEAGSGQADPANGVPGLGFGRDGADGAQRDADVPVQGAEFFQPRQPDYEVRAVDDQLGHRRLRADPPGELGGMICLVSMI